MNQFEISDCHSSVPKNSNLLGCDTVSQGELFWCFKRL